MAFMERIEPSVSDGELAVLRLLRHYGAMRGQLDDGCQLSRFVALGRTLHISPEGSVALASVFQLTEAVLGRYMSTECCCARSMSRDERAIIRLLSVRLPNLPGTGTPDIPHGLPGALAWAVLSFRQLAVDILPFQLRPSRAADPGCSFLPDVTA